MRCTRSVPAICSCTVRPVLARVAAVVVAFPPTGSWTPRSVRMSLVAWRSTSSKAKLSKISISSGSVTARVET